MSVISPSRARPRGTHAFYFIYLRGELRHQRRLRQSLAQRAAAWR